MTLMVQIMEKHRKYNLCSEEFDSLSKLNTHNECNLKVVRKRSKKSCRCNMCGYECSRGKDLITHMRKHTGERPFECKIGDCGMAFKDKSALTRHIARKHSDGSPFECNFPGCLRKAKTIWDLMKHKKVHSDDRPYACTHAGCNYRAKRKPDLSEHTANVHSESKPFSCSKCDLKTNSAKRLAKHMIGHEGRNDNIPCSVEGCEYKGKNIKALKEHLRRHRTLLSCPVSGCDRYVRTKEALEDHVQRHNSSGRAFQCTLCIKHFPALAQLQRHCAIHTNEKPFQCGQCEFAAAQQARVKRHVSLVHSEMEFPFIVHIPNDRECLRCRVTLPCSEFVAHCKGHVDS